MHNLCLRRLQQETVGAKLFFFEALISKRAVKARAYAKDEHANSAG